MWLSLYAGNPGQYTNHMWHQLPRDYSVYIIQLHFRLSYSGTYMITCLQHDYFHSPSWCIQHSSKRINNWTCKHFHSVVITSWFLTGHTAQHILVYWSWTCEKLSEVLRSPERGRKHEYCPASLKSAAYIHALLTTRQISLLGTCVSLRNFAIVSFLPQDAMRHDICCRHVSVS